MPAGAAVSRRSWLDVQRSQAFRRLNANAAIHLTPQKTCRLA
jgi:hypothetical protein